MDKVLCPWCGSEMKLEESLPFSGVYAYTCECGAVSPNECGKEEAYAAAIRRPLQKPLTLEEACKSEEPCVYFEQKGVNGIDAVIINEVDVRGTKMNAIFEIGVDEDACEYTIDEKYGKTWRCWATKPTQEEREEAKWE